ncbi:MAG: hypothetical protein WD176_08595, partial [Pirellulales bacterium]
ALFRDDEEVPPEWMALLQRYMDWCAKPFRTDGLFDFGDSSYLSEGVHVVAETTRRRYTRAMPMSGLIARHYLGLNALLLRLGARVPAKTIADEEAAVTNWDNPVQ